MAPTLAPSDPRRFGRALTRCPDPEAARAGFDDFVTKHGTELAMLNDAVLDDVLLACACAGQSALAIAALISRHKGLVRQVGDRVFGGGEVDDFSQRMWEHLLVSDGTAPARIGRYGGRGRLQSFIRMVASRLAIDIQRAAGTAAPPAVSLDASVLAELDHSSTLETREAKRAVAKALERALGCLKPSERRALRMRYVLGLSVARTAVVLGVHEVSVSRLVTRVRGRVMAQVRAELAEGEAHLAPKVVAALARSLDVSVERWLRSCPE